MNVNELKLVKMASRLEALSKELMSKSQAGMSQSRYESLEWELDKFSDLLLSWANEAEDDEC